jgi:chlorophyllide a reductase subunit Z
MQEIVNRLYDGLLNFLPVDGAYAAARGQGGAPAAAPSGQSGNLRWSSDARDLLDAELQKLPYLPRISASRQLQMVIEGIARQQGATEVTVDVVNAGLAANRS